MMVDNVSQGKIPDDEFYEMIGRPVFQKFHEEWMIVPYVQNLQIQTLSNANTEDNFQHEGVEGDKDKEDEEKYDDKFLEEALEKEEVEDANYDDKILEDSDDERKKGEDEEKRKRELAFQQKQAKDRPSYFQNIMDMIDQERDDYLFSLQLEKQFKEKYAWQEDLERIEKEERNKGAGTSREAKLRGRVENKGRGRRGGASRGGNGRGKAPRGRREGSRSWRLWLGNKPH